HHRADAGDAGAASFAHAAGGSSSRRSRTHFGAHREDRGDRGGEGAREHAARTGGDRAAWRGSLDAPEDPWHPMAPHPLRAKALLGCRRWQGSA
ncbi:unnamed protein product, partial [Discosporangium mesarthrocarpum]